MNIYVNGEKNINYDREQRNILQENNYISIGLGTSSAFYYGSTYKAQDKMLALEMHPELRYNKPNYKKLVAN